MVRPAGSTGGQIPGRGRPDTELHRRRGGGRAAAWHRLLAGRGDAEGQSGFAAATGAAAGAGGRQDRVHGRPPAGQTRAVLRTRPGAADRFAAQGRVHQRRHPVGETGQPRRTAASGPGGDGFGGGGAGRGPARQGRWFRRSRVRAGDGRRADRTADGMRHDRARTPVAARGNDPGHRPRRAGRHHRDTRAGHHLRRWSPPAGRRDLLGGPDRGEDRRDPAADRPAIDSRPVTAAAIRTRFRWEFWRSPADQPGWARPALLAIAALAGVGYGWAMARANVDTFYGASARSMSESWHDFIFGAFDPAGTITVDKLPGALWVQALSLRLFGFHICAMVLPQVVEGVLTILVLYRAVRRLAGPAAGLTAATVLAVTPITVLLSRGNVSDSLLILLLVLAADATSAALLTGSLRQLLLAGAWVG